MTERDYAFLLLERSRQGRVRNLKARIRARLIQRRPDRFRSTLKARHKPRNMGAQKHYLNNLVCACAPDNGFAQEAIEYAIISGWVQLSGHYNLEIDTITVMNHYDQIIAGYHMVTLGRDEELAA